MTEGFRFNTSDADRGIPAGQPLHGPSPAEVLDLQGLSDRCLGNLELAQRVLDKFEQRLPAELAELERVAELGDAAKIALVAHRIKGNSSNISAAGLQQAAAEIEDLSCAGRVADIPAAPAELARAVAAVCRLPRDAPAGARGHRRARPGLRHGD